jgi:hypothetical protein
MVLILFFEPTSDKGSQNRYLTVSVRSWRYRSWFFLTQPRIGTHFTYYLGGNQ